MSFYDRFASDLDFYEYCNPGEPECRECAALLLHPEEPCQNCEYLVDHCRECGEEMPMSRHDRCQACRCVAIVRMEA